MNPSVDVIYKNIRLYGVAEGELVCTEWVGTI